jgi:cytochrome c oxidase subunit 1
LADAPHVSAAAAPTLPAAVPRNDVLSWLTTTDHKRIGVLYLITSLGYFGVAGLLSLAIRTQLARPNNTFVTAHEYAQLFTLHGTAMIFLFVAPFAFGLGNFLIPLQIGAADMAFPRLNATSYWLFLFGDSSCSWARQRARARPPPAGLPIRPFRKSR